MNKVLYTSVGRFSAPLVKYQGAWLLDQMVRTYLVS